MPKRRVDLHAMLDDLCERHLGRTLDDVDIEWGVPSDYVANALACIGLDEDDELVITIDHALALPWVPCYFLRDVVWHEACHAVLYERTGEPFGDMDHGPTFRVLESLHRDRLRAAAWERRHGERLSSSIHRRLSARRG